MNIRQIHFFVTRPFRSAGLIVSVVAITMCLAACDYTSREASMWKHTGNPNYVQIINQEHEYEQLAAAAPISPQRATEIMGRCPPRITYSQPCFFAGQWYAFPDSLSKVGWHLRGYYVNSQTGQIEFRESRGIIDRSTRSVEKNAWSKIEPIAVPE